MAELTAIEAEKKDRADKYNNGYESGFYALHPFSLSCEGIWDFDKFMWFNPEEYYQAQQDV